MGKITSNRSYKNNIIQGEVWESTVETNSKHKKYFFKGKVNIKTKDTKVQMNFLISVLGGF